MRCFVTGGAGFVGSKITKKLLDKGHEVVVYDNLSVGRKENIPEGSRFIQGDILDKDSLIKAMSGMDVVFHEAAFVSIRNSFFEPRREFETNVTGTLNVLDAMLAADVHKIVYASSMAVYGIPSREKVQEDDLIQPISPYGLSKLRGEMLCNIYAERFGIAYDVLRYFNIFGEGQQFSEYVGVITAFIKFASEKKPITVCGDGLQERDFVFVEDVAEANIRAMKVLSNSIYNIASGTKTSIISIAEAVANQYKGSEIIYIPKPPGEIDSICARVQSAQERLGFSATTDVLQYIPTLCKM